MRAHARADAGAAWSRRRRPNGGSQYICGASCRWMLCEKHKCEKCDDSRVPASRFCVGHKCARSDCELARTGTSQMCAGHKCADGNCDADGGGQLRSSSYCAAHRCLRPSCGRRRLAPSEYCVEHKCASCSALRSDTNQYCDLHRCGAAGCDTERAASSMFCQLHADALAGSPGICQAEVVWLNVGFDYVRRRRSSAAPSALLPGVGSSNCPTPTHGRATASSRHPSSHDVWRGSPDCAPHPGSPNSNEKSHPSTGAGSDKDSDMQGLGMPALARDGSSSLPVDDVDTPGVTPRQRPRDRAQGGGSERGSERGSFGGFGILTDSGRPGSPLSAAGCLRTPLPRVPARSAIRVGHYELGRVMGRGAFSEVRLALDALEPMGPSWAVKVLSVENMRQLGAEALLCNEIALLKHFQHDHLLRLCDCFRSGNLVFMVLELLEGGELFDIISDSGRLSEEVAQVYFAQLLSGVVYMHDRGVAHRDLKPENVIFDAEGVLHIADFGFATRQPPGQLLDENLGTPEYQAPEVACCARYDGMKADMWSLGVVLFVMLAGWLPFDAESAVELDAAKQAPVELPDDFPAAARELVHRLMRLTPEDRPSARDVFADPWVRAGHARAGCSSDCEAPAQAPARSRLGDIPPVSLADLPEVPVEGGERLLSGKFGRSVGWISGLYDEARDFIGSFGARGMQQTPSVPVPKNAFTLRQRGHRGGTRRRVGGGH